MLNGYLTRRTAVVLPALFAVTLGLVAVVFLITSTPAAAQSNSLPATPSSVSITRADGTVTASWPAVSGATKYHATYTTEQRRQLARSGQQSHQHLHQQRYVQWRQRQDVHRGRAGRQ